MADITGSLPVVDTSDGTIGSTAPTIGSFAAGKNGSGNLTALTLDANSGLLIAGEGTAGSNVGGVLTIQGNASGVAVPISGTITANAGTNLNTSLLALQSGANKLLDTSGTGTISALNGTVTASTNGASTIFVNIIGTWVATLVFEGQDGNGNWNLILGTVAGQGNASSSTGINNPYVIPCGGFNQVRVRANLYTSGTATVNYNVGAGVNSLQAFNLIPSSLQVTATQTGTWNINNISGTISLPTGASTSALQTTGNTSLSTIATTLTLAQGSTTSGQTGGLTMGAVTTTAPTYSTGQTDSLSLTLTGALRTDGSGTTQPISGIVTARLNDGSGNTINSNNSQLQTRDVINTSAQYRAQSVTTTAAEALGAGTILVNRKVLCITPTNGTIYWGTSNAVTTTTGTPLFANQTLTLSFTDNVHVFVIAAATTDARILEAS